MQLAGYIQSLTDRSDEFAEQRKAAKAGKALGAAGAGCEGGEGDGDAAAAGTSAGGKKGGGGVKSRRSKSTGGGKGKPPPQAPAAKVAAGKKRKQDAAGSKGGSVVSLCLCACCDVMAAGPHSTMQCQHASGLSILGVLEKDTYMYPINKHGHPPCRQDLKLPIPDPWGACVKQGCHLRDDMDMCAAPRTVLPQYVRVSPSTTLAGQEGKVLCQGT